MSRNFYVTSRSAPGASTPTGSHSRSSGPLRYEKSTPEDREFAAALFAITFFGSIPLCFLAGVYLFQ